LIDSLLGWLQANPPGPGIVPVLAAVAFLETVFPPFPGDVLFVVLSSWAGTSRSLPPPIALPWPVLHWTTSALAGLAGCLAGTVILLLAGRWAAGSAAAGSLAKLIGHRRLERAQRLFHAHGWSALLGSRFIPGVRSVLVFVAGSSRMKFVSALAWAGASALLWYSLLAVIGDGIGRNLTPARSFFRHYEDLVLAVVAAGALALLAAAAVRRRNKR